MGSTFCPKHGRDKPRRWVSVAIAEAIEADGCFPNDIRHVVIVYPDTARVCIAFVDACDHARFEKYAAEKRQDLTKYDLVARLTSQLPLGSIILVSHDRTAKRLNDKIFILKSTKRLRSVCAQCLREALRARAEITDNDLNIPNLYEGIGLEFSPFVLERLMGPSLSPKKEG